MKSIKALREMVKIQCSNGNWNYDPYMHGMANGLICALATMEGKEPEYLVAPEKWLYDSKISKKPISSLSGTCEPGKEKPETPTP